MLVNTKYKKKWIYKNNPPYIGMETFSLKNFSFLLFWQVSQSWKIFFQTTTRPILAQTLQPWMAKVQVLNLWDEGGRRHGGGLNLLLRLSGQYFFVSIYFLSANQIIGGLKWPHQPGLKYVQIINFQSNHNIIIKCHPILLL